MRKSKRILTTKYKVVFLLPLLISILVHPSLMADSTPIPDTAYDGGVISAESLGRGQTIASNLGTLGSGSENPASLMGSFASSLYTSVMVNMKSNLPDSEVRNIDPIRNRVLQYLSIGADKGVLYFEPLGRIDSEEPLDPNNPTGDYRDVEFTANAVGIAGAEKMGSGSVGLSLAYLFSSLATTEIRAGSDDKSNLDTGNGVRLNFGVKYPTGPFIWGLMFQNFPGFVWWKDHKRDMLPIRIRAGNTWQAAKAMFFSVDVEKRFYNEGSNSDTYYYYGSETFLSKQTVFRLGLFSSDMKSSETYHWTGGLGLRFSNDVDLSYGFETFKDLPTKEKINKSFVSLRMPFLSN